MRFAVNYATKNLTTIAVGDAPPYATIVIPGQAPGRRRDEEDVEPDEALEDVELIDGLPASLKPHEVKKLRKVTTRRQLEALRPRALAKVPTKRGFKKLLRPGDVVVMAGGGIGNMFAYVAQGTGATVTLIPTFRLRAVLDEREEGLEPHIAIAEVHRREPDLFRPMPERDSLMSRLRILHRTRVAVMGDFRKPAKQRLDRALEDMALLAPEDRLEAHLRREWAVGLLLRRPFERLAEDEERLRTLGRLLEDLKELLDGAEIKIPKSFREGTQGIAQGLRAIATERRGMEANPLYYQAKLAETEIEAELARLLERIPIWGALFEKIPGMGVRVGSAIVAETYDVSRFPTPPNYANYSGWGFNRDGTRQRRKKGEVAAWNEYLKQAFYLWVTGIVKTGRTVIVRSDAPLILGDRVRLEDGSYVKDPAGDTVSFVSEESIEDCLEGLREELDKKEEGSKAAAHLEALIAELEERHGRGGETVRIAMVAPNLWRAYYDEKRRVLLAKYPRPVEATVMVKRRTREGVREVPMKILRFTRQWIHQTAMAKTITQLIDYLWTEWAKAEAPEVYRAWHEPREARFRAWRQHTEPGAPVADPKAAAAE